MKYRLSLPLLLAAAGFPLSAHGHGQAQQTIAASQPVAATSVADAPIAAYQSELLDIAFGAATAIPVQPHIRDRSRAQDAVVSTCLKLDQPQRALRCADKIDNWLRGSGYADFAFYCAQHGDTSTVERYLNLAAQIVASEEDWRRDQVRVKIAKTYVWLGQPQKAAVFETGLVDSESGKVDAVRAMRDDAAMFEERLGGLSEVLTTRNFDLVKNALEACGELFNRFYGDEPRRTRVELTMRNAWRNLPVIVRIDLMMSLATFALEHHDQGKALTLVNEARTTLDANQWLPEDRIRMAASLASQRALAGEKEKAREEANAALAQFAAERENIVNIYRGRPLRPLAEAYQSMGDTAAALNIYKKAVEEGIDNPNSKPRAEDLSATCCSMALHKIEPDAELWARLRNIHAGLGQPW